MSVSASQWNLVDEQWRARIAADPGVASDCSYSEQHRISHVPHPDSGRPVCLVCHPPMPRLRK